MPRRQPPTILLVVLATAVARVAHAQSDPYEWQRQQREQMIRDENFALQQQQRAEYSQKQIELMGQYNAARAKAAVLSAQEAREKKARAARRYPALWSSGLAPETSGALRRVLAFGHRVTGLAFTSGGGHVFTFGRNGYDARKAPAALLDALAEAHASGQEIRSVTVNDAGTWAFLRNLNGYSCDPRAPSGLISALAKNATGPVRASHVTLTDDGGYGLIIGSNGFETNGLPAGLLASIQKANENRVRVDGLVSTGGWLLLWDERSAEWSQVPRGLEAALREAYRVRATVHAIALSADGRWAVVGEVTDPKHPAAVRLVANR